MFIRTLNLRFHEQLRTLHCSYLTSSYHYLFPSCVQNLDILFKVSMILNDLFFLLVSTTDHETLSAGYSLTQCIKSADLLTPAYRDYLENIGEKALDPGVPIGNIYWHNGLPYMCFYL